MPTVYGFVDGKPIDAFQGAQPESKIEVMINKLIDASHLAMKYRETYRRGREFIQTRKYEESQKIYENLITLDPGNAKIIAGMLRCLMQLQKYDDAKEVLES